MAIPTTQNRSISGNLVEINPALAAWMNQNKGMAFADPAAAYAYQFGPGRIVSGQSLFDRGFEDVALNANYFRPDSGTTSRPQAVLPEFNPPNTMLENLLTMAPLAIAGAGLFLGGGAAAGGMSAADTVGLTQMGEAAGLSGPALDAFVASGGTAGSTAAGGGGVGLGAIAGGSGTGMPGASILDPSTWSNPFSNLFNSGANTLPGINGPISVNSGAVSGAMGGGTGGIAAPGFGGGVGVTTGGSGMMDFFELLKQAGLMPGSGGPISNLLNIGSGIYGMMQSNKMMDLAQQAAQMQDPFGPQRPQYQAALANLYANPSSITSMPGYQAGLNAVERKMASQGYLGSGNMMAALSQYGGDFFDKEVARLSMLSGAQFAPTGGNALLTGTQFGNDLASRSLATLGYGVRGLGW